MVNRKDELVNVSALNQYLYCPRRYWYIKFYDTIGSSYEFEDGNLKHEHKSNKGGWTNEIYLEDKEIGIKGKIDVLEDGKTPVERKRGGQYFENDIMQVAGYCMLVEEATGEEINEGIIYLYKQDKRVRIPISQEKKQKVKETIQKIQDLDPDNPPPIIDNRNKCKGCSVRSYCMPEETEKLGEDGQGNLVEDES